VSGLRRFGRHNVDRYVQLNGPDGVTFIVVRTEGGPPTNLLHALVDIAHALALSCAFRGVGSRLEWVADGQYQIAFLLPDAD